MKSNKSILLVAVVAAFTVASCARKEPPVVVEQQQVQQPPVVTAASAIPEPPAPARESAWRPAPVRSVAPKQSSPAVVTPQPVAVARPAIVAPPPPAPSEPAPAPAPTPVETKGAVIPPPAPQPSKVTLAEGSILAVRIGETLTSEKNENGDSWSGVLAEPLVINGLVIAERGARVEGRVTDVQRAGRVKGVAGLSVALTRFNTADGQRINVQTSSFARAGKDETRRDVGKVAIASGIGAAIGAIAGRGKGAAIGAGAGAAAGTGAVLVGRGGPAVIPTETLIRFRVAEPVTITEKLK